jgi:thiosulfate/3-mercaptopyruvate sulfurtransferase
MFTTLVSTSELVAHLDDPDWLVFDCRHDLTDTEAGRHAYAQAHIPGARFLHLDEDLSGPKTGSNGRHPLPDPQKFCARLAALGMRNGAQVVGYDASGGYYAARLWWMLRWVGHPHVAVLDGGWDAWPQAGAAVTSQLPIVHPAPFNGSARDVAVDTRCVLDGLGKPDHIVIDARSPDRFRGENETLDPVGGHIPGARNRFFRNNLAADGRFKTAAALRDEYTQLIGPTSPRGVVHQCGSGVTACHNLLAMEIAGFSGSRLYPGSWSAWCSNPQRPVAR